MIWHKFENEKPKDKSRVVVRDKDEYNLGMHADEQLFYDEPTNSFISPLGVSHFRCDMNNIVYWGYYKDMYK